MPASAHSCSAISSEAAWMCDEGVTTYCRLGVFVLCHRLHDQRGESTQQLPCNFRIRNPYRKPGRGLWSIRSHANSSKLNGD